MMPTFHAIAGVENPKDIDGVNLLPVLQGQKNQLDREYLYWEFPAYGGQQAVRMGDWKAVRKNIDDGNLEIELYDLEKDNSEQHDLSDKYPDIVEKMESIMKKEHTRPELDKFRMTELEME